MRHIMTGLFMAVLLMGCSGEPPQKSTDVVPIASVCDDTHKGKLVAVEGYLALPETINENESSIIAWLVENPESADKPLAGVSLQTGDGPNRIVKPKTQYTDEDLDVTTNDGAKVGYSDRVRISGTPDKPAVPQKWGCRIDNPYVEKV